MKANELAKIYKEKIAIIQDKHCDTLIENNLNVIIGLAANLTSSKLKTLAAEASIMDSKNRAASCPIYRGEDY